MNTTFRAFVSSTFEDLKDHRARVITALRKAGVFVDPMEDWTAASDEPRVFSQERVSGCHLVILLVAFRRGHVPRDEVLSITQLEYQAAIKEGLDVLVFMLDEQAAWPRKFDEFEKDPEVRRWRKELGERWGISFFDHDPESIEIQAALARWSMQKARQMAAAMEDLERLLMEKSAEVHGSTLRQMKELHASIESLQDFEAGRALHV